MPSTVSNTDVANLATLLAHHGIAVPPQLLAIRDNASPTTAAARRPDGAPAAPAAAPAGASVGGLEGNNDNESVVAVEQVHIRCPHCNNNLVLDIQPAGSSGSGAIGKRWYAISVGRQTGVFYGTWETEFKQLVSGVPHGFARRFSNEADARAHFDAMVAAGRSWVHIPS
ncbi:hypothetical protein EYR36_000184 [Pleurotus pulmonarius]|nr:hypothetical protein EYR36_000184 [Pleurotus pulmonarius]